MFQGDYCFSAKQLRELGPQVLQKWEVLFGHPPTRNLDEGLVYFQSVMGGAQLPGGEIQVQSTFGHALARWQSFGQPTFYLHEGFLAQSLLTDYKHLTWGDLHWPFETFIVFFPPNADYLVHTGGRVQHAIIHNYDVHKDGNIYAHSIFDEDKDDIQPGLFFTASGGPINIHQNLKLNAMRDKQIDDTWGSETFTAWEPEQQDTLAIRRVIHVVCGLAVHLATLKAQGAWSPNPPKRKQRKGKKAKKPLPKHWDIHPTIKIKPQLKRAALQGAENSPLWKLEHRYLVRGHWRNQAYGPNRSKRQLKWIAPYWKGPEDTEVLERTYDVLDRQKTTETKPTPLTDGGQKQS